MVTLIMDNTLHLNSVKERSKFLMNLQGLDYLQLKIIHVLKWHILGMDACSKSLYRKMFIHICDIIINKHILNISLIYPNYLYIQKTHLWLICFGESANEFFFFFCQGLRLAQSVAGFCWSFSCSQVLCKAQY